MAKGQELDLPLPLSAAKKKPGQHVTQRLPAAADATPTTKLAVELIRRWRRARPLAASRCAQQSGFRYGRGSFTDLSAERA
jgi:hypothetical protein